MAEGIVPGLEAADLEESVATTDITILETLPGLVGETSLDVRPKEHLGLQKLLAIQERPEAGQSGAEAWWLGPLGTGDQW